MAALHCWSSSRRARGDPPRAEAERPFFATAFLVGAMDDSLPKAVRDRATAFTVDELEKLFEDAGFVDVVVRKEALACAASVLYASSAPSSRSGRRAACDSGVVSFYDFGVRM